MEEDELPVAEGEFCCRQFFYGLGAVACERCFHALYFFKQQETIVNT
jgi:hypothetical protein